MHTSRRTDGERRWEGWNWNRSGMGGRSVRWRFDTQNKKIRENYQSWGVVQLPTQVNAYCSFNKLSKSLKTTITIALCLSSPISGINHLKGGLKVERKQETSRNFIFQKSSLGLREVPIFQTATKPLAHQLPRYKLHHRVDKYQGTFPPWPPAINSPKGLHGGRWYCHHNQNRCEPRRKLTFELQKIFHAGVVRKNIYSHNVTQTLMYTV